MLLGCSSQPKVSKLSGDQYCHTKQLIQTDNNETVNSTTTVVCSDDPIDQYMPARTGLAKDCYLAHVPLYRNGYFIQEKIYVCKKVNGSFDVIEPIRVR